MKAPPAFLPNAATMFAAVVVALLAVEGVLRLIHYQYTPLRIEVINKWSEWRYYHAYEDRHFVYDPVLIWRPREDGEFFNKQGFRGKLLGAVRDGPRIFAIGDSNTLGWPGSGAPNWPMYLEQ